MLPTADSMDDRIHESQQPEIEKQKLKHTDHICDVVNQGWSVLDFHWTLKLSEFSNVKLKFE